MRPLTHLSAATPPAMYARSGWMVADSGVLLIDTVQARNYSPASLDPVIFHEGAPGHYMMMEAEAGRAKPHAIAQYNPIAAIAEGWAMYGEGLARAMGLVRRPDEELALLNSERQRAARLIVDYEVNANGWTVPKSVAFLVEHGFTRELAEFEVQRYLSIPGQGAAYTIGLHELRELRATVVARKGTQFSENEFDVIVLRAGAVSLGVTRVRLMAWLNQ